MLTPREKARREAALICQRYRVTMEEVTSPSRREAVIRARDEITFLLWNKYGWSTTRTGRFIGRDHSTVVNALTRFYHREGYENSYTQRYRRRLAYLRNGWRKAA